MLSPGMLLSYLVVCDGAKVGGGDVLGAGKKESECGVLAAGGQGSWTRLWVGATVCHQETVGKNKGIYCVYRSTSTGKEDSMSLFKT